MFEIKRCYHSFREMTNKPKSSDPRQWFVISRFSEYTPFLPTEIQKRNKQRIVMTCSCDKNASIAFYHITFYGHFKNYSNEVSKANVYQRQRIRFFIRLFLLGISNLNSLRSFIEAANKKVVKFKSRESFLLSRVFFSIFSYFLLECSVSGFSEILFKNKAIGLFQLGRFNVVDFNWISPTYIKRVRGLHLASKAKGFPENIQDYFGEFILLTIKKHQEYKWNVALLWRFLIFLKSFLLSQANKTKCADKLN